METAHANRLAVGSHTAAVARELKRLGMRRCSERLVQYQFKPGPLRLDWYGLFRRWVKALRGAHRAGADLIFNDFVGWYQSLCGGDELLACDWESAVDACVDEHGDAIKEAFRADDYEAVIKESSEAITAYRRLIALAHARAGLKSQARDRRAVARTTAAAQGRRPRTAGPQIFEVGDESYPQEIRAASGAGHAHHAQAGGGHALPHP